MKRMQCCLPLNQKPALYTYFNFQYFTKIMTVAKKVLQIISINIKKIYLNNSKLSNFISNAKEVMDIKFKVSCAYKSIYQLKYKYKKKNLQFSHRQYSIFLNINLHPKLFNVQLQIVITAVITSIL